MNAPETWEGTDSEGEESHGLFQGLCERLRGMVPRRSPASGIRSP